MYDIATCPTTDKIVNSLRHVKSEEQLPDGAVDSGTASSDDNSHPGSEASAASAASAAAVNGGTIRTSASVCSLPVLPSRLPPPHSSQELSADYLDEEDMALTQFYYPGLNRRNRDRDTISQMSMDSTDSREPVFIAAGDIRYGNIDVGRLRNPLTMQCISLSAAASPSASTSSRRRTSSATPRTRRPPC